MAKNLIKMYNSVALVIISGVQWLIANCQSGTHHHRRFLESTDLDAVTKENGLKN